MFAQINHVALISPQWPLLGRFYEAAFGLRASPTRQASAAQRHHRRRRPRRAQHQSARDRFPAGSIISASGRRCRDRARTRAAQISRGELREAALDAALRRLYRGRSRRQHLRPRAEEERHAHRHLCRPGGGRLGAGALHQQIRHPHAASRDGRRILSRCVRAQPLNRPDVPGFHLSDGRVAVDPALVAGALRGHGGVASRPRPFRLQGRESSRPSKQQVGEVAGLNPISRRCRSAAARRPTGASRSSPKAPPASCRWPIRKATGWTSRTSDAWRWITALRL